MRGATTTKKTLIYLDRSLELLSPSFPSLGSKKRFSSSFLARLGWTFVVAVDASSVMISFPTLLKMKRALFFIRACVFARRVSHCSPVQVLSSSATTDERKEHRALATTTTTTTHNNNDNTTNESYFLLRRVIFFLQKIQKFSLSLFCVTSF